MSSEIRKCELHPVRLDSDVWAAVKAHPVSLNKLLREVLLGNDKPFTPEIEKRIAAQVKPREPLLKPKDRALK